jgi:hypothetical protein
MGDINDEIKELNKKNSKEFWVFNPMISDFSFKWDGKDEINGIKLIIPSCKAVSFPYYLQQHAINCLVNYMISKEHNGYVNDVIIEKYRKEVEI